MVDAAERLDCSLPKTRNFVIHIVQQLQRNALALCISQPIHGLFSTLQCSGETAPAFFCDALPVARKLIDYSARQDDIHAAVPNKLLNNAKGRVTAIVFR